MSTSTRATVPTRSSRCAPSDETREADVQAAEQTQVEYADGRLSVKAPKNKLRSLLGRPPSIDVTIEPAERLTRRRQGLGGLPRSRAASANPRFDTAAGSIRLDQTGGLKLRTGAGDVSVGRSSGHADVSTSSGKIWIGEVDGTAVVKTANGDITVGEVTDDVRLTTANGDITVDRALAAVSAKTAYGSVRIGEVVRGTVALETSFGEVELGVKEGTAAWLDVGSQHGSVRSELEAGDSPESPPRPSRSTPAPASATS